MSFSSDIKEELSRLPAHDRHCTLAELAAVISFCGRIGQPVPGEYSIILHTENAAVARRFYLLIKNAFLYQSEVSFIQQEYLKKNKVYMITVDDPAAALQALRTVGLIDNLGQIDEEHGLLDNPILKRTCCRRAFLRGAFLSSGSVTDPEKNYHFEITSTSENMAEQLKDLLEYFGLDAKIVIRKKYYVVYLKDGSMISEALNIIEAHLSMMQFENVRILKDVRNSVNRRVNCETANINKTVSAARKQIDDITYIKNTIGLDKLPGTLRDVASARLEEPDATLRELGEMLSPPVGKSGVNHRLRKLSQMAQNIRESGHI